MPLWPRVIRYAGAPHAGHHAQHRAPAVVDTCRVGDRVPPPNAAPRVLPVDYGDNAVFLVVGEFWGLSANVQVMVIANVNDFRVLSVIRARAGALGNTEYPWAKRAIE